MSLGPEIKFDRGRADPGATETDFKVGETMLALLRGLPYRVQMSALLNCTGVTICETSNTETKALDTARNFRRELERCIRTNWPQVEKDRKAQ